MTLTKNLKKLVLDQNTTRDRIKEAGFLLLKRVVDLPTLEMMYKKSKKDRVTREQ